MSFVEISNVVKTYHQVRVLDRVSLSIEKGEFITLLGPSGCGKSTLLRAIAGLNPIDEGRIMVGGRDITHLPPKKRDVGMVFQSYALFPNMTVFENIAFGLKMEKLDKKEIRRAVSEMISLIELEGKENHYPHELSGGQQQLAAVASALAADAGLMLFDEAASMLDPPSRRRLLDAVRIASGRGNAVVWATHSMDEAALADRILALEGGRLRFDGSPRDFFYGDENGDAPCRRLGLEPPVFVRIAEELEKSGRAVPERPLDENGFWSMVERLWS